jgi:hypothetical protein
MVPFGPVTGWNRVSSFRPPPIGEGHISKKISLSPVCTHLDVVRRQHRARRVVIEETKGRRQRDCISRSGHRDSKWVTMTEIQRACAR